jgi:ribosomal-protein-serine acetyltransferase
MFVHNLSDTVVIRLLETRHSDDFYNLVRNNFDRLAKWCPWLDRVTTPESTRAFIREKIFRFADANGFTAGIFERGKLIGVIALEYVDEVNSVTEVGYWIDGRAEGKGLVSRACTSVIDYAFGELRLHRVQIRCADGNLRSRAIPEKLGFRNEGIIRRCERLRDRTVDLVIYGMLSEEWVQRQAWFDRPLQTQ